MNRVASTWNGFWFAPEPTSTLAIFRIAFATLTFFWTLSLLPDLDAFFARDGIEPPHPIDLAHGDWGVLNLIDTHAVVLALVVVLLLGSLALLVGFKTRLASIIVFVGIVSFMQRTPSIFNAGDVLIRSCAFFLMFAPAGAALSVDRWRHNRHSFWASPSRAPWALRLIQIQVSVMYLASVWEKLHGAAWRNGTAVSLTLGLQDFQRFAAPGFIVHSLLISTVMTYLTLAIELMVGILVWNRAARPLVLALGASLHLSIDVGLRVGFFSEAVLTAYIAFLSPAAATAGVTAVRRRLKRSATPRTNPEPANATVTVARSATMTTSGPNPRGLSGARTYVPGESPLGR
jgi:hypothetical protein